MEDDLKKWKTTLKKMEDYLKKWGTTLKKMEDDLKKMEDEQVTQT